MITSFMSLILSLVVPTLVLDTEAIKRDVKQVDRVEKTRQAKAKAKAKKRVRRISHNRSSTRTSRTSQPTKNLPAPVKAEEAKTDERPTPTPKTTVEPVDQVTDDEHRVVNGVHRFYKDARDLRAQFTQIYTYTVYDRSQTSSGRVFFKKPRMMRWDYQKPVSKVFVADGQMLWVYEPEENQAFRRKLGSSQLPVALTFMTGSGDLRQEFDIDVKTENPKHFTLEMRPKKNEGDYKKVILTVDRTSFAVLTSTIIDAVGNKNQVIFKDMKTNTNLKDSGFKFTPPSGVRIIKE
jgi:outer membrane lipoprotein carrier protein